MKGRIQKKGNNSKKARLKEKGITLIALVVTIIILLILAGVAISAVVRDNGLFSRAKESTTLSKIASMEEEARTIYLDLFTGEYLGKNEQASMSNVVSKLLQKGYEIEQIPLGEADGISVDNSELKLLAGETGTINIIYNGSTEGIKYYAKIDNGYYEIKEENGEIVISRETQEEIESGEDNLKVDITSGSDKITIKEEGNNIKVTAGETGGTATISVTYGTGDPVVCNVTIVKMPTADTTPTNTEPEFSTDYGRIDVIWLKDNSNTVAELANEPNLYNGGLTPVTWSQDSTTKNWSENTEDSEVKQKWYDYSESNRYWANAKNADGSYFVWIPRYAYRITYYSEPECTKATGYYDGYGMYDAINATLNYKVDEGIETVDYNGMKYIVHPAFTGVGKEDNGGGFGDANGITGFWVAKFEMSRETSSDSGVNWIPQTTSSSSIGNIAVTESNKTSIRAVSKPYSEAKKISSWRYINIGNSYLNSYNYDRNKESHLMKNSEWGAVAYLAHSKYGRNGQEVTVNNNSNCYTGIAGDTVNAPEASDAVNTYETAKGTLASTTGNVYGIYDMSGGAWEYTAAFDKLGTITSHGQLMADTTKNSEANYISTKYVTAYSNGSSDYSSITKIMLVGKTGDATKEVIKRSNSNFWNEDRSYIPCSDMPFVERSGNYTGTSVCGVFFASVKVGDGTSSGSFRVVLAN